MRNINLENEDELKTALEDDLYFWQQVLKLEHWKVKLHVKDDLGSCVGTCDWTLGTAEAVICIVSKKGYDVKGYAFPYAPETILVHEILHLHFAPLQIPSDTVPGYNEETADLRTVFEERAIEHIAQALVALRHAAES